MGLLFNLLLEEISDELMSYFSNLEVKNKEVLQNFMSKLKKYKGAKVSSDGLRVYIPVNIEDIHIDRSDAHFQFKIISNKLNELGYKTTFKLYLKGYAIDKYDRKIKIGKILNKFGLDELRRAYENDPIRSGMALATRKERELGEVGSVFYLVFSAKPYDIAHMSTDRGWTSCMEIFASSDVDEFPAYNIACDIRAGNVIVYLVFKDDENIVNPIARVMIRLLFNTINGDYRYFAENRAYGNFPALVSIVEGILEDIYGKYDKDGYFVATDSYNSDMKLPIIIGDRDKVTLERFKQWLHSKYQATVKEKDGKYVVTVYGDFVYPINDFPNYGDHRDVLAWFGLNVKFDEIRGDFIFDYDTKSSLIYKHSLYIPKVGGDVILKTPIIGDDYMGVEIKTVNGNMYMMESGGRFDGVILVEYVKGDVEFLVDEHTKYVSHVYAHEIGGDLIIKPVKDNDIVAYVGIGILYTKVNGILKIKNIGEINLMGTSTDIIEIDADSLDTVYFKYRKNVNKDIKEIRVKRGIELLVIKDNDEVVDISELFPNAKVKYI